MYNDEKDSITVIKLKVLRVNENEKDSITVIQLSVLKVNKVFFCNISKLQ